MSVRPAERAPTRARTAGRPKHSQQGSRKGESKRHNPSICRGLGNLTFLAISRSGGAKYGETERPCSGSVRAPNPPLELTEPEQTGPTRTEPERAADVRDRLGCRGVGVRVVLGGSAITLWKQRGYDDSLSRSNRSKQGGALNPWKQRGYGDPKSGSWRHGWHGCCTRETRARAKCVPSEPLARRLHAHSTRAEQNACQANCWHGDCRGLQMPCHRWLGTRFAGGCKCRANQKTAGGKTVGGWS